MLFRSFLQAVHEVLTVVPQDGQGNDQQGNAQGGQQSSGPGAPETNPAPGLQPSGFSGDFLQQALGHHFFLYPDGSCKMVGADGKPRYLGQFSVSGDSLLLDAWASKATATIKIQGNSFIAGKGIVWTRVGDVPAPSVAPGQVFPGTTDAQRAAFSGEYLRQADGQRTTIFSDGTYKAILPSGRAIAGQYSVDGNTLIITSPSAVADQRSTVVGDKLISETGSSFSVRVGDAPAPVAAAGSPAPLQSIPPPPPPADTPPPTVSVKMGESKDKITADFGQPTKTVKLGVKEIYYYKDMKVTFMNGKVSNIE